MNSRSRSKGKQEQSKIMDYMDIDQALEVPDTPDRLIAASHNSDASKNNRVVSKDNINGCMKNQSRENQKSGIVNGNQRLFISPESCSNSPVSLRSSCSFKNVRPMLDTARRDKGKVLCNSNGQRSTREEGGSFADLAKQNGHGYPGISRLNASRKGLLPLNDFPATDSLETSSQSCKSNNAVKIGPSSDHGKGVDIAVGAHHESNASRVLRQKRLVRNGCISPHNIAKSKNVAEKHETCSVAKEHSGSGNVASEGPSTTFDIKDLIAEAKESRRCKGKGVSCHPSSSEEPKTRNRHMSHRISILEESAYGSSGFSVDASKSFAESQGWRTTHNHTKDRDIEHQKETAQSDLRNQRNSVHADASYDPPSMVSRHAPKLSIKRQRDGAVSSHNGDCSGSRLDDSAGEPSTARSKRNKSLRGVGTSNPVPEPNIRHDINEDSSVRARQVEADERLAKELQEQLYNEEHEPATENDEMDSDLALAMALQRDNSSRRAGGRHAYHHQGPSTLSAHQFTRQFTSRRPSVRRAIQPRARTTSRMARLRDRYSSRPRGILSASTLRNSIFPPNMDVDTRMEILETLEDIGDMRVRNDLLQVGREFNEDDYEMLLALDEDNDTHGGATRAQINNLPESTVQAENLQECTICLETPTIGETIRHLPCLHRFHKECIDRWLRRKTSCPVCKSSVT